MIADIFINSIYVLDDGLKLGLNFSDGVDTIPLHQWNDAQCSDSLGYAPPDYHSSEWYFFVSRGEVKGRGDAAG